MDCRLSANHLLGKTLTVETCLALGRRGGKQRQTVPYDIRLAFHRQVIPAGIEIGNRFRKFIEKRPAGEIDVHK
ncbi:hypothetical protein SDC9_147373 [bioreactor metagenome]|uniref:Uncharacterized protein n=1 Tax=bioreactor metagenome TaxID=1076179 RepID=A0A645EGC3_9ZZZZ